MLTRLPSFEDISRRCGDRESAKKPHSILMVLFHHRADAIFRDDGEQPNVQRMPRRRKDAHLCRDAGVDDRPNVIETQ